MLLLMVLLLRLSLDMEPLLWDVFSPSYFMVAEADSMCMELSLTMPATLCSRRPCSLNSRSRSSAIPELWDRTLFWSLRAEKRHKG